MLRINYRTLNDSLCVIGLLLFLELCNLFLFLTDMLL